MYRLCMIVWSTIISICAVPVGAQGSCLDGIVIEPNAELAYLRAIFPNVGFRTPTGNPHLGLQNITYCCLKAVDQWLHNDCQNNSEVHISKAILQPQSQFPCGAYWNGNPQGAPEVDVAYNWTAGNCPGWQRSRVYRVNDWAQLLAAFILPAVVFSFNIPRPGKLKVWEEFFPHRFTHYRVIGSIPGAIGAAVCVTVDAVVWLMVSIAFAGPLLMSGLYEAMLDKRTLAFLHRQIQRGRTPIALQARILFTILCGNLDMRSAWCDTMDLATRLDKLDREWPEFQQLANQPPRVQISHWTDSQPDSFHLSHALSPTSGIGQFSADLPATTGALPEPQMLLGVQDSSREPNDSDPLNYQAYLDVSSRGYAVSTEVIKDKLVLHRTRSATSVSETGDRYSMNDHVIARPTRPSERTKMVHKVVVRLKAMLACQYSFGSTIGGPIVFFIGSFVYTLLDIAQDVGDGNIAEALAFGMWWTVIPHVATVAGLLLAGNNPNILEAIVSRHEFRYSFGEHLMNSNSRSQLALDSHPVSINEPTQKWHSSLIERVYDVDAGYIPAWMWERGRCKHNWLTVLFADSWLKYHTPNGNPPRQVRETLERFLQDAVMLGTLDWVFLWTFTMILVGIPFTFAFITVYYTPPIGIGCRSIMLTGYMSAQILLSTLWVYYLTNKDKYWATAWTIKSTLHGRQTPLTQPKLQSLIRRLQPESRQDPSGASRYNPDSSYHGPFDSIATLLQPKDETTTTSRVLFIVFGTSLFLISLFTSIGGSLMQLIGAYRTRFCLLNASEWYRASHSPAFVTLSSNTEEDILTAQRNWIILGACNVVFLGIVCYIGWWYQRSLRSLFKTVAQSMEKEQEVEDLTHEDTDNENYHLLNRRGATSSEHELDSLR